MTAFSHTHRVSYRDCTVGNHVYYSRYLDFLEEARGEFFRSLGASLSVWQERGAIFPVIECHLRYRSPARYDDVLHIDIWPAVIDRVRLTFSYRVVKQTGHVVLEAKTTHVCTGLDEKPKRLPEELRHALEKLRASREAEPVMSARGEQ